MLKLLRRFIKKDHAPISLYAEVPYLAAENKARAYVNLGRWLCDCPRRDCTNAALLEPRQGIFQCSYCLLIAPVEWPPDAEEIWRELCRRPVPSTRNWFPHMHELALAANCPHGQTVAELREEFAEHQAPAAVAVTADDPDDARYWDDDDWDTGDYDAVEDED